MTTEIPNPLYEPYPAATWLMSAYPALGHLTRRVGCFTNHAPAADQPADVHPTSYLCVCEAVHPRTYRWADIELDRLAEIIAVYDGDERRHEQDIHHAADEYAVMSGGERRILRMVAVLAPGPERVMFNLGDIDGNDREFVDAWRQLVARTGA